MSVGTSAALSADDVGLLVILTLVAWLPGALVGTTAGLRGWTLAASAPLLTYGVVGLAGPASSVLGARWSVLPLLVATAVVAAVCAALVRAFAGEPREPSPWRAAAHAAVAACVAAAAVLAALVVLRGMKGLRTIPQDWDAVFHAGGIRWILENGDAGLEAMARVTAYELPDGAFYPNAYHLIGAVVAQLSGRDIPSVLNATTVLTLAILALGVAALVRRFGGRAVHAGAAALIAVASTSFYDLFWRGPLLPFAMGVALLPAGLVLLADLLETTGARNRVSRAVPFVLGVGGALALHPGVLVTLVVLAVPVVLARTSLGVERLARDVAAAVLAGTVTLLVFGAQVAGTVSSASGEAVSWPANHTVGDAVGQVLMFSHDRDSPQWWFAIALLVGLVAHRQLGRLRWVPGAALIVAALFVAAASYDTRWAEALTRAWWNDRYRLAGIIVIPFAILAGHGVAVAARIVTDGVLRVVGRWFRELPRARATATSATIAVLVLAALTVTTDGLYLPRNATVMQENTGEGPAVSSGEVAGFRVLATMVPPNERVMNDLGDGSAWMYALDGVHPVATHYSDALIGPDAKLLSERFDDYGTDPAVRAAAARLNVHWAVVDEGFLRDGATRKPGLVDIDRMADARLIWSNDAVRIYRLATR